eukprot:GHVP01024151.1.p1 GENE.GHVP01024151.1~~GHVP01024151.1.p1  ORF type:complete len:210 (-),score=34.31 GHVP01024151.1:73-660(-)
MHAITQFAEFAVPSLNNAWANDEDLLPSHNEAPPADITFRMVEEQSDDDATDGSASLGATEAAKDKKLRELHRWTAKEDTTGFAVFESALKRISSFLGGITIEEHVPKEELSNYPYKKQAESASDTHNDREEAFCAGKLCVFVSVNDKKTGKRPERRGVHCTYSYDMVSKASKAIFYVDKKDGKIFPIECPMLDV